MSGLAGILNLDGAPVDAALLARMTQHLTFRGPDAQATWAEGPAGLGHTLLRTTLEAGRERQPLSLDGAVWIAADGRVDGRAELLRALRGMGREVDTAAPDVELILHAYHAWGEACLERLIGDFTFAIWDGPRRRLLCARDQFGVVPFYYAQAGQTLLVSNTLNALRLHPGLSDKINEQAIGDYLLFGFNDDSGTTSFADIRRLPPAHRLMVVDGQAQVTRYWAPPAAPILYRSPQDTVTEFGALFEQAVADRLRTERAAAQLSGGMDSASVALTACRLRDRDGVPHELRAHTLVVRKGAADEEDRYANLVAEAARLPREVVASHEEPSAAPTRAAGAAPSRFRTPPEPGLPAGGASEKLNDRIAQFSRVLLAGYGADPLLYPSQTYLPELVRTLRWGRLIQGLSQSWRMQGGLPPLYARTWLKRRLGRSAHRPLPTWLRRSFAMRLGLAERWQRRCEPTQPADYRLGMANDAFWPELFTRANAGYTGRLLELRSPFFDVRLLSFALSVPPVPWFTNKLLLREAMRDIMPEPVRRRPKTPLGAFPMPAPTQPGGQPDWMLELAAAPELEPYVDGKQLQLFVQAPGTRNALDYALLYQPLGLAYWLKHRRQLE